MLLSIITHFFPILLKAFHMTLTPTLLHCCFDFYLQRSKRIKVVHQEILIRTDVYIYNQHRGICMVISRLISDLNIIGFSHFQLFSQSIDFTWPSPWLVLLQWIASCSHFTNGIVPVDAKGIDDQNLTKHTPTACSKSLYWTVPTQTTQNSSKRSC